MEVLITPFIPFIMTLRQLCGSPKRLLILLLLLIPLLSACDPKEPTNELLNKRHDNPSYVIFTLKEAKLNNLKRGDAEPTLADITLTGREEKMKLSLTSKGFLASEEQGVSHFSVKSTTTQPDAVYLLEIEYLDARREPMTGQFIENAQDRIHQHFFERFTREFIRGKWRTYAVKELSELGYDYRYVDVTPWNQPYHAPESKFTGTSNPMGFKGLIRFTHPDWKFLLTIMLMHAHQPKVYNGKTMPFYDNLLYPIDQESDISLNVLFVVDAGSTDLTTPKESSSN